MPIKRYASSESEFCIIETMLGSVEVHYKEHDSRGYEGFEVHNSRPLNGTKDTLSLGYGSRIIKRLLLIGQRGL